jgi:hypothetical protein
MGSCCSTEQGGQRLGGSQETTQQPSNQPQMADREAMLRAAEQRKKVRSLDAGKGRNWSTGQKTERSEFNWTRKSHSNE